VIGVFLVKLKNVTRNNLPSYFITTTDQLTNQHVFSSFNVFCSLDMKGKTCESPKKEKKAVFVRVTYRYFLFFAFSTFNTSTST